METETEEPRVNTLRGQAVAVLRLLMVRMGKVIHLTAKPIVNSIKPV